jgi:malonyl CoA-acyl carrier protein transacylase
MKMRRGSSRWGAQPQLWSSFKDGWPNCARSGCNEFPSPEHGTVTTGDWLPSEPAILREALAAQVASPVRWQQGVRTLIGAGARQLVEIGSGDLLTKFGFFIDRRVRHVAMLPAPRPAA